MQPRKFFLERVLDAEGPDTPPKLILEKEEHALLQSQKVTKVSILLFVFK